jgi:two-component system sensor histidine kinase PilS (NtrC family)
MVCTVIFGGTVAVHLAEGRGLDGPTPRLLLSVIIAIYLASLGYSLQIRRASLPRLRFLTTLSIAGDLLAWSVLTYATGGAGSPLSSFFGLSTLTAALVLGGVGTLWTAVLGLGAYGILGILMSTGVLRPLADQVYATPNAVETTYQMVVTVTAVVLIAAIGGSLAERLLLTGDALVRSEASRANVVALYEDVIRSTPVALVTFDAEGRIDGINPSAATMLGPQAPELLGTPVQERLPFVPGNVIAGVGQAAHGDASLELSGGTVPVSWHATPLYTRDGVVRGGLVVVDDRSQEERLREEVANAERFATLGRLAAGLAHEIRNPLGAILGCVELVRETAPLSDEERKLLTTVTRDVARLNDLVTDMLQFARFRPPEPRTADLAMLVREVATLARTSGGPEAKVTLAVDAPKELSARVDPAQLKQVVWNLLRNAAQVSRPGAEVTLALRRSDGVVELAVLDRGPGVDPGQRDKLFEAFYSDTARGTGLGLAIVKRIAEGHGGEVLILPREGGGSEFVFRCPG